VSAGVDEAVWQCLVLALAIGAAPASAQWTVRGTGLVSVIKHRVDAGYGVEPSSGVAVGGEVTVGADRFTVHLLAQAGSLQTQTPGAIARDVAEAAARFDAVALPWLTIQAGAGRQTYSTLLARQSWTMINIGAEGRLAFSESGVSGTIRGAVLPGVWVSGLDKPDIAFTGAAGMEYRRRHATVGLLYSLERYRFPAGAMAQRREQITALTLKAGWSLH
jgi:hypothetical protein